MTPKAVPPEAKAEEQDTSLPAAVVRTFGEQSFHTDGDIVAVAFATPEVICSIEEPGLLRHWEVQTGRRISEAHLSDVETLWQFSQGARLLASANDALTLWDVSTGRKLFYRPQPSWVTAFAFTPDSSLLISGHDDGNVRIWSMMESEPVRVLEWHKLPISAIAISPDGKRLACAGEDRIISLWDLNEGQRVGSLLGHTDRIDALAWHPDGKVLVSAGWDTTARVWDTNSCDPIILLNGHSDQVIAIAFSPDGKTLACADSADVLFLWEPLTGKLKNKLLDHEGEIRCLAFSPDGQTLASAGADQIIHVDNLEEQDTPVDRDNSWLPGSSIALPPDGGRLASTCMGTAVQVWNTTDGARVPLEGGADQSFLTYSPDGRWLASGGMDRIVRVWDAATCKPLKKLEGQRGRVAALAFAPDSHTLASASAIDGMVWIWDITSAEPVLVIPVAADNCMIEAIAYSPSGRILAVGGIDWLATGGSAGAVCLWDLVERAPIHTLDSGGTLSVTFHPTGLRLAAGALDGGISIWEVDTQRCLLDLTGHAELVSSLAYSPDGRWLASGSDDHTLRIWDAESGESLAVQHFDTQVKALCFSPDSRLLYTGNSNTTNYQIDVERLLRDA
jgi:WD40 repeat protein